MNEKISMDNIKLPIVYENKITIQLFDDLTGKQVEEVKTHNLLTNGAAKMAYMDRYFSRLRDGKNSANPTAGNSPSWNGGGNIYTPYANPFDVLILMNTGIPENADQTFLQGTKIGWAEKSVPYAGGDNLRGTINTSETTFNEPNNLHYVFDFPTNAANGTFDTIFWHSCFDNCFDLLYSGGYPYLISDIGFGSWSDTGRTAAYGGIAYQSGRNTVIISEFTYYLMKQATLNKRTNISAILGGATISGLFVDANNIWVITTDNKIYKLDKNYALVSSITISNIPSGYSQHYNYSGGLWMYNGNFYTTFWKSGANTLLSTINSTGVVTANKDIGSDTQIKNISVVGTNLFLTNGAYGGTLGTGGIYNLSNNLNQIGTFAEFSVGDVAYNWNGNISTITYDVVKQYWMCGICRNTVVSNIAPLYLVPPGAMANVAPSVTKTATNTMKIQYDFNIDIAVF
jgi:hypothetical protein